MTRRTFGNFDLVTYKGDHPPLHVHICRDGRLIGRWDIENQKPMDDFKLTKEILNALKSAGYR